MRFANVSLRNCLAILLVFVGDGAWGQGTSVLRLDPEDAFGGPIAADRGVVGLRQRLLELRTTASVMQVTAHPDDEQSGLLTWFSRGTGARTGLLSLNRGEAGANAVGPELFDALGLLRAEELLLAAKYYGLDDLYFTSAVDYGFSKSMGEAARSWDTTAVLADMVRAIRVNQPVVVMSRWYGGARDGHGQHQLAGALTPLAVAAAADSMRFPEQFRGSTLRPWRVHRLFRANLPPDDRADVVIDAGRHDPWLGESYQSLGATGLSLQRSQTSGRRSTSNGPSPQRLQLVAGPAITSPDDPFAGLDTSLPGIFALVGEPEPAGARAKLQEVDEAARLALASLQPDEPWTIVPHLLRGWRGLKSLRGVENTRVSRANDLISTKMVQFERAIATAIGLEVRAVAVSSDDDRLVPGDSIDVEVVVRHASPLAVRVRFAATATFPTSWTTVDGPERTDVVVRDSALRRVVPLQVYDSAVMVARPVFRRRSIEENRYHVVGSALPHAAQSIPPSMVIVAVEVDGVSMIMFRAIRYARSDAPNGVTHPHLSTVPPVTLRASPSVRVVTGTGARRESVSVQVMGNSRRAFDAAVFLSANGVPVTREQLVRVERGATRTVSFEVNLPANADSITFTATARVGKATWTDDVTEIVHRDLEPTRLYTNATARLRRVPVSVRAGLRVGYVMGVGDLVPDAIAQLGATVTLIDSARLSSGRFQGLDAIVIGTRAYAVRQDLVNATPALIDWARRGGNLVVLYQTQEFKPETMAPFRALLPGNAEEVTEQDAPVQLLAPNHQLLQAPNRITARDFDDWIEQRGSKFLTEFAPEYTALVEMHDTGQAPQQGIWVTANVGRGRWTYVALALHRQLPYAVPGAYRILANLLSSQRR